MKNLSKYVYFLFTLLTLSSLFLLAKLASAQIPPTEIPCNNVADPEFHSLRPYQANSLCQSETASYAAFCGNTLTLEETITKTFDPNDPNCKRNGSKVTCSYTEYVPPHLITINLSEAELPIMGNTEEVINSQSNEETLDDVTKVNEYVSWYLNGVTNRAEYPFLNEDDPTVNDKIINYSGPINKLLPQEVQQQYRAQTVKNASKTQHNQIVGCTYGINILGKAIGGIPGPCYEEGLVSLVKQTHRLDEWKNHLPPARSDYKDSVDYQKAYEKWRGKACFKIPIPSLIPFIGGKEILLCGENPLSPNYYSSLYSYIPLSSTEDLEGNIKVDALSSATGSGVTNIKFNNQSPATLFFPHIQESDQLGSILQNTYISNEQINEKVGANTAVESPTSCTTVDVRSNNGDSLFATSITGNLEYAASFTCDFDPPVCVGNPSTRYAPQCTKELQGKCVPPDWSCDLKFSQQDCPTGYICGQGCFCEEPVQTCKKSIYISLSTTSNTPIIDDVWSRLVAGPTAVVKRLFPKLGDQIGTLKDLPGSTDISYTGAESSSATLNLPHVGGISEYFLKGIQTLLRPKGYGEPISFGETEIGNCDQTTLPNIPDATEQSCKVCGYSLSPTFKKIIESAGQTFGVPGSVILGTIYHEGAFSRGIDWSEENVIKWSLCGGEVPGCDKNATSVAQIPFGWIPYYFYGDDSLWSAVQKIDSTRTKATISPCNVLDGIYATAKALSVWSGGLSTSVKYPTHLDPTQAYSQFPDTCYNWNLNNGTGAVMSCDLWNENTVATSQVGYAGYCPEPGKHPIGQVFPDNAPFIQQTVGYFNSNTCK